VTANKALLATHGFSLMKTAAAQNVRLEFEGSVCGGVPVIRALRSGLAGNQIQSISGILNGTCNYILTRMAEDRVDFAEALQEAQAKGFAEADPALDIDGHDAAQKLKILTELAHNTRLERGRSRRDSLHFCRRYMCRTRTRLRNQASRYRRDHRRTRIAWCRARVLAGLPRSG
jgi:homoserine dehydrogenase